MRLKLMSFNVLNCIGKLCHTAVLWSCRSVTALIVNGELHIRIAFFGNADRSNISMNKSLDRTIQSISMCEGSPEPNVLPQRPSITVNFRPLPGDTVDDVEKHIRKAIRANIVAAARSGLFFIPLIFILPHFFGLLGVEMCQAWADFCSFAVAIPIALVMTTPVGPKKPAVNGMECI